MHQFEPIGEENTFQELCKDLLNLVYNTISFQIYKPKGAAQYGIDIYSPEILIAAQCKKKKIIRGDRVLESELIKDIDDSVKLIGSFPFEFKTLIFMSTSKKYSKVQDHIYQVAKAQTYEILYWSWEEIEPYIAEYEKLRKKYYSHLWHSEQAIPQILTYIPKLSQDEIIGRESDLLRLEDLMITSSKIVLVNGLGGIGKSTLAKLLVNKTITKYDHIVWIDVSYLDSTESFKHNRVVDSLVNNIPLIRNLRLEFSVEDSINDKLFVILNKLQNIGGKNLMIIDNVSSEVIEIEERLPSSKSWIIVITSRELIDNYSLFKLDALTDIDAEKLFYLYYKIETSDCLSDVLTYVGNHTLTVELLARTANKRRLLIKELITSLEREGLNISKAAKLQKNNGREEVYLKPFDYLLSIFSIAQISDSQRTILRYCAIVAVKNVVYSDLIILFGITNEQLFFDDLLDLVSKGWLQEEKNFFSIHQVIREVLYYRLEPNFQNSSSIVPGIVNLLSFDYNESYLSKVQYLKIADEAIKEFSDYQEEISDLINLTAIIHDSNGDSLLAIKYYEKLMPTENNETKRDGNRLYNNIAICWLRLGNYSEALTYNLKNIDFLEQNHTSKNTIELAICYNNTAENYRHLGYMHRAIEFNLKAIDTFKSTEQGQEHIELATAYNNLSNSYGALENNQESLRFGLLATQIRELKLGPDHPNLAQSYNNLGVDYEKLGDFTKSLHYHRKSLVIREKIHKLDHYDLAESYNNLAELYRATEKYKESILYHNKSIKIRKSVFPKDHPEISSAYGNLAAVYASTYNFNKADELYDLSIDMRIRSGIRDFKLALFQFNYAVLCTLKKNYSKAVTLINSSVGLFASLIDQSDVVYIRALEFQTFLNSRLINSNMVKTNKPGRNEPCHCGSGKKYKTCCIGKETL